MCMNTFSRSLGSSSGIVLIGSVVNEEADMEMVYYYPVSPYTSSSLCVMIIDRQTKSVLGTMSSDLTIKPSYSDYFYYRGRFVDLGIPANKRKVYYSPIGRLNKLFEIAHDSHNNALSAKGFERLRAEYKGTKVERLLTPNFLILLNKLSFLPPDADELTSMGALLRFQYYGGSSNTITLERTNARTLYIRQLGMAMSGIILHGYKDVYKRKLIKLISNDDLGELINMFFDQPGGISPYTRAASWKSPIDQHIRWDNNKPMVSLGDYTNISLVNGFLHNPFLE